MNKKKIVGGLILTLLMVFSGGVSVRPAWASEFSFGVTPETPENQIDKEQSYFDLKMTPAQKETVYVKLQNDLDRQVKVDVAVNSAMTNSNVIVDYSKQSEKVDSSLKYDLAKLVKVPKQVTIEPQSALRVPFELTMPDAKFDGVIAGGITFKEAKDSAKETKDSSTDKGLAIENEYSYVVALLMRQNQNAVAPNLKLHKVEPGQRNARNVIFSNLQNDQMTYINQVAIKAEITKKGATDVLYQEKKENLQIAPNTNFDFPVPLKGEPLKPGDYHLKLVVNGNKDPKGKIVDGKDAEGKELRYQNQWILEKDFTITGEVARKLNKQDVTIKQDYTWVFILIGILLLLLVILIIWLIRRKKQKDEADQRKVE